MSVAYWVATYTAGPGALTYYGSVGWHSHEMLFGYTVAVLAGFLLTAVPNWANAPTAAGGTLAALALLWLAGRVLGLLGQHVAPLLIAVVDLAFLPALALSLSRPLLQSAQRRNLVFLVVLLLMALANLAIHGQRLGITGNTAGIGTRMQLSLIVLVMVLIAGRVIPFFTERALPGYVPVPRVWIERLAIGSVIAWVVVQLALPDPLLLAVVGAFAACVHAARLERLV